MTNKVSFNFQQECSFISLKDLCKHKMLFTDCKFGCIQSDIFALNNKAKEIIRKKRIFSPSNWIKNIKISKIEILPKRNQVYDKYEHKWEDNVTHNNKKDSLLSFSPQQLVLMVQIHDQIITKTSKLVQDAKNSKFAGFFSPRRLRNRIRRGDLNRIALNPQAIERNWFSQCNQTAAWSRNLNYFDSLKSSEDPNNFCSFNLQNKVSERVCFNIDSFAKCIKTKCKRKNRLKSISKKYQEFKNGENTANDEDYFGTRYY